jgi:hypothetical protein
VNFPFICSNIPAAPAYGVYISQLIRYSRACGSYQDFLDRWLLLSKKLLNQGFLLVKLKSYDHGYAPLVVSTSRSFPRSWLITGFVTRLTRRVSLVEQELSPFRSTWVHPRFLVGFVLLDLWFYMHVL